MNDRIQNILQKMQILQRDCKTLSFKEFKKDADELGFLYKKLSDWEQGEYHHYWCEWLKEQKE